MNPRDFLDQAQELIEGEREVDWRSAASRAYYAAFLVACEVLQSAGFVLPGDQKSHAYVWLRLSNCGRAEVSAAGADLSDLRQYRGRADYDMKRPIDHHDAARRVDLASQVVRVLDDLAESEAILATVVEAIRVYERDVLKDVTYRDS
jgi:uncharacterized protein (UPF0332 family)